MRRHNIIRKIHEKFHTRQYKRCTFDSYNDYLEIQHRCEPKEFLDSRIKIVSSFVYILPILEEIGISEKVYHERGIIKGQLIEDKISILDAGSRDGWVVEFLNSLGYSNVIGVELLEDYVDYGKVRKRNVIQGDLHNLKFRDDYFDVVYCRHVLEHCLDPIAVLDQLMRVTKTGRGALYCSFPLEKDTCGKHTIAIPSISTVRRILKKIRYDYEPIYVGMARDIPTISEGDEAVIFILKSGFGKGRKYLFC